MTDHSAGHIAQVLDNVDYLVAHDAFEGEGDRPSFSAADAYTLCLAILFHDAGMVYGRENHESSVAKVYDLVRTATHEAPLQEKGLVYRIALAHTGTTNAGSKDTIAAVPESMDLDGERVHARELAAILRFADELAEGPQRTSNLLGQPPFSLDPDSTVYHRYASISNVHIDRQLGRIALTYRFDIGHKKLDPNQSYFRDLLEFTFSRAEKVDSERRYTRFYSQQLEPFNRTDVVLNFWHKMGLILDLGPLELSAKTALDRHPSPLQAIDPRFDADRIIDQLRRTATGQA
ncbi:MAG: hypothetical protein OXN89_22935 [Bryobacterales bacterium]|nr:hypothetical protein [Bryobacterales bacterium]